MTPPPRWTREPWGPSHQTRPSGPAKGPLWFRVWMGGLLLVWSTNDPTLSALLIIVGGGFLAALVVQTRIETVVGQRSPSSRIGDR